MSYCKDCKHSKYCKKHKVWFCMRPQITSRVTGEQRTAPVDCELSRVTSEMCGNETRWFE